LALIMLHKVSTWRGERKCETVLYSKQFDKLFHYRYVNCELLQNSQSELTTVTSVVNKDLSFKAKAKAKDLTSEHVQGPL